MAIASSLLVDPLGPIALWPCRLVLLSLRSVLPSLPTDQRSYRVKGSEVGQQLRSIAAVGEREPGELPRGIAAVGAGEQSAHDRQHAYHDRGDPGDPDGRKASQFDFGRIPHDEEHFRVYRIFESGEFPTEGSTRQANVYPGSCRSLVAPQPRPQLEGGPATLPSLAAAGGAHPTRMAVGHLAQGGELGGRSTHGRDERSFDEH